VAARIGPRAVVASSIFGASLDPPVRCFDPLPQHPGARAKAVLRVLDHSAIYLLIAGTYTPFTLVSWRGSWGWGLFTGHLGLLAWAVSALEVTRLRRVPVCGGWRSSLPGRWDAGPHRLSALSQAVAPAGIVLLFLGGVSYSVA